VRSEAAAVYQFLEASMMNACKAGKGKRRIGQIFVRIVRKRGNRLIFYFTAYYSP
jgi:hypothetical protein